MRGRAARRRLAPLAAVAVVALGLQPTASAAATSATPDAVVVEVGSLRSGNEARLAADDDQFLQVASTTSGTRTTQWFGSFRGVPRTLADLKVTYRGKNSAACTQTLSIWNWSNSTWVLLDTRSVSTTEVQLTDLVPAGTLASYVGGTAATGDLELLVKCTRTSNFTANGELMRISYEPSGPPPPPPRPPSEIGAWGAPLTWPLMAMHATVMRNGQVLITDWEGGTPNNDQVWNPATGQVTSRPLTADDLACGGQTTMADGRVLYVGGSPAYAGINDAWIFDPTSQSWTAGAPMARTRWYPTATGLPDGRVLVTSGDGITIDNQGGPNPFINRSDDSVPEIYDPAANTWTELPLAVRDMPLYPFMYVGPDGRVYDTGPDTTTRALDLATGRWTSVATSPIDGHTAVLYRPGLVLKAGRWADPSHEIPKGPSSNRAAVLDLNARPIAWHEVAPMHSPRSYQNMVVLPDGDVLAVGGGTTTDGTDPANAVMTPELWDPDTNTWTELAPMRQPRLYHSVAVLLPDARVLVAGGGRVLGAADYTDAEVYSPPYLFKGPRPTIGSAPATIGVGGTFDVATPDAARIASVSLVALGASTHSVDMGQRFVPLAFSSTGTTLRIDTPGNANTAPPGQYLLFLVDSAGVPSVAAHVRVSAAPSVDTRAPTAPTALTASAAGPGSVALSWTAASDDVGVAGYDVHRSATAGFTPSVATKVGTAVGTSYTDAGVPGGTWRYRVVARDAAGNVSPPSAEVTTVVQSDTAAPGVAVSEPAAGATVHDSQTVTATATDDVGVVGVQLLLDGASLGAEDTVAPYSVIWNTRTAGNGPHQLSARARDAAGNVTTSGSVAVTVANAGVPGLVAAWSFDEGLGTVARDGTANHNDGTLSNATWNAAGRYGGAVSFNGTNASVVVPDSASLDITSAFTIEAWVRPAAAFGGTFRTVVLKERPGGLAYSLYGSTWANRPSLEVSLPASVDVVGTAALAPGVWTHLAGTFNGTTLRLFVNGAQVATRQASGAAVTSTGALRIGGNSVWGEWFSGLIDEVRIYDRALSATELQGDMVSSQAKSLSEALPRTSGLEGDAAVARYLNPHVSHDDHEEHP